MKKSFICILIIIILALNLSCNRLSNDFFEFLFNSKKISLSRDCSDNPSLFSEGRTFEVYSIQESNPKLIVKDVFDKTNFSRSKNYPRYIIPEWKNTPVIDKQNAVYSFINSEMDNDKNMCYDKKDLIKILRQKGNYYTFLNDNLGRVKLFIWDYESSKLFLLTSYEL